MGGHKPDYDLDDEWEPESWEEELDEWEDESWLDDDPLEALFPKSMQLEWN
ncbi:hypothetical protein [Aeromonas salmonicida]|uniref:hypothetical protein n=1 Tax=Aeromonas salmonicida TaxID=645 RepID=UPI000B595A71|nr:hypothetical protein [Aeromonas salmonicida]ASI21707.1 hypothetical protein CE456_02510 [Aeromonas salmonicida]ASI26023.1 hypothetical protein CE463_02540 [Aeromonas salmonicida]ASI30141.1 hypothetical protein CE462_01435 [Aeromonas salmonicida]QOI93077.1 hypothetical protein G7042_19160 [Aeromonas salmonicida subsp. masoucida]QYH24373.1 hypothetical protein G9H43_00545 [Aeromonas salmonicida subsp. masoucida]